MAAEDGHMIGPLQLEVSQCLENVFFELAGTVQWLASYFTNLFSRTKQMTQKISIVNCWHSDGGTDFVSFFSSCRILSLGFSVLDRITGCMWNMLFHPPSGLASNLSTYHNLTSSEMLSENDHEGMYHMSDNLIVLCVSSQRLRITNLHLALKSESTPVWRAWKTMCYETGAGQRSPTAGWNTR